MSFKLALFRSFLILDKDAPRNDHAGLAIHLSLAVRAGSGGGGNG